MLLELRVNRSVSMLMRLLSARRGEPSLDLVRLDAGQLDDLVSRAAARKRVTRSTAAPRGTSARSASTASFALPRSGAAATRIFHASPWRPTIPGAREAPGVTRSRSLVVEATPQG